MSTLPTKTDVLVIGAGAVGLCAAHELRKAGREVTVVTQDPVGIGASAGNAGMIVPSHIVPLSAPGVVSKGLRWLTNPESPFYIQPRANLDLARWLWSFWRHANATHVGQSIPILRDLSLASVEAFAELQGEIGDVGYAQTGLLMLFNSKKGKEENLDAANVAESAGLRVERLNEAQLRELEPGLKTPAIGAVLYRQDGRVDPDRFLAALAAHLESEGVGIHSGISVTGFTRSGGTVSAVTTSAGTIEANEVVVAAGSWSPQLARDLRMRLPVQPAKGYSLTVDAPDDGPTIPMILSEDKITVTPLPGRLRFGGTLALSGFDASVDERRIAPIRRLAAAYVGETDAAEVEAWSGFRPCTPDGLPIIGRSPRQENVTVATGHGMMGLTLAPVTGKLVTAIVQGSRHVVPVAPFRVDRF